MNAEILKPKIVEFLEGNSLRTKFVAEAIYFYSALTVKSEAEIKDYIVESEVTGWIESAKEYILWIETERAKAN